MRSYLSKVWTITGEKTRALPWMLVLYFLSLGLELLGLSLIIPFVAILQNPDRLNDYQIWQDFSAIAQNYTGLKGAASGLVVLSVGIFIIYLLKAILNIQIQKVILCFSYDLQHYLRVKFSRLFLSGPYLFHTKRRSNEIINMLQSHISQFPKAVVGSLLRVTGESLTLIAVFIFLLMAYPVPTITAIFVLGGFGFFYDRLIRKRLKAAGKETISAKNDQLKAVRQGIQSLKEARILGCGSFFHNKVVQSSRRASDVNALVAIFQMMPRYILEFLVVAIVILSSIFMLVTEGGGVNIIDSLAVFAVAAIRLLPTSNQILSNISSLRYSHRSVEELYADLRELEQPVQDLTETEKHPEFSAPYESLSLRGINFTYPQTTRPVLSQINLDLKKGEIVGIVGESGAGKSTLVDLILGLIEAKDGEIKLNGASVDFKDWAHHQLAAYIPQSPTMLDETMAENVALGQEDIDIPRVEQALEKAQLLDFIKSLPKGLETIAGENAVLLSGGQRQRLALARAFYFRRPLIILDEATSALDKDTEQDILTALEALKADATILIITHSEHPLQICDRVCYLSEGRIVKETNAS